MLELRLNQDSDTDNHVMVFSTDETDFMLEGSVLELVAKSMDNLTELAMNPYGYEFTLDEAKQLHEFLGKVIKEVEGK